MLAYKASSWQAQACSSSGSTSRSTSTTTTGFRLFTTFAGRTGSILKAHPYEGYPGEDVIAGYCTPNVAPDLIDAAREETAPFDVFKPYIHIRSSSFLERMREMPP
ncbi:hypothetical protein C8Q74DRAFT_1006147 [Fomes fomentarius]|nr:hypothetical protein C8Q74DRAFT_1006147 [Fomes fomentarius]